MFLHLNVALLTKFANYNCICNLLTLSFWESSPVIKFNKERKDLGMTK